MILTKKVKIKTKGKSIKYYRDLGYDASNNTIIEIAVNELSNGSDVKIDVLCDICETEINIIYRTYINSVKNGGFYCCSKCKNEKSKITCSKKYGVDNISKLDSIKKQKEETCLKNYGVSNPSHSKEVIEKIQNTFLEKYGVKHALQNKNFLNRMFHTMNSKYGVKHALHDKKFLEKLKETSIRRYNVEHKSHLEDFQQKSKETRIKNKNQIPDELFSDYELYKRQVIKITNRCKKELIENWDGIDFYDGEDIKDNFNLYKPRNKNYPSIDHKISIIYGFINQIDEKIVGSIDNLCITKTSINCSKRDLHFEQFIEELKS